MASHPAHRVDLDAEGAMGLSVLVSSLPDLDRTQLFLQWRNHLSGIPPAHLQTWLLARVLAYRLQATGSGDLDPRLLRKLKDAEDALTGAEPAPFANRPPATRDGVDLRRGAILVREWRGKLERMTVLKTGYAWNGRTYRSLSIIAKAITGTSWSGRRHGSGAPSTAASPPTPVSSRTSTRSTTSARPPRPI
jgi:hypothetical protein